MGLDPPARSRGARARPSSSTESREPDRFVPVPTPFFREAGSGPGVVCLHSNASSSSQWRALLEMLAPRFHVLAPDGYGAGRSPPWPADRIVRLRDEVELIEPVLARAGAPAALVGHSYGAAVALVAAVSKPGKVRALALYEPTLFAVVDAASPSPNDVDGIRDAVARGVAAVDSGDLDGAARVFVDFWMGEGAWARTPEVRKGPIAVAVANIGPWSDALFGEPTPLEAFAALDLPVLLMVGSESPPSSRGVARLLTRALPRVATVELEGLGHMGPITHPGIVNQTIRRFLEET